MALGQCCHMLILWDNPYIAFTPCTLSVSEQNYTQIEKEALSLIAGIHKFQIAMFTVGISS